MHRPVIVCGLGKVGRRVIDCLHGDGVPVVVIDHRPADALPAGVRAIEGDCRSARVLEGAGVCHARGVIICVSDDLVNIATALAVRSLNRDVRIVVRTFKPNLVERLAKSVKNVVALSVSGFVAPLVSLIARTGSALGTVQTPDGPMPVVELTATDGSDLVGRPLMSLGVTPLAYLPAVGPTLYLRDVPGERNLAAGDRVVACGTPADIRRLAGAVGGADEAVHWAGWPRRGWRVVRRFLADIDRPLKICLVLLVAVLGLSTLVYKAVSGDTLSTAFYQTISIMANASEKNADHLAGYAKVYIGLLRVTGTALLAAFTAIFTNYHVRARLGGALELHRVPEGGHVVLCGLGNVGFRVIEDLLRASQSVVVVEPNRENPFIASARRLGAAVLIGDATMAEVLRRARVGTARAVIAATSADLVNVEIAVLARELAPAGRVVVRLTDIDLARLLRDAANVRLAISLPVLAAPAFAAALYGDRVQAVFLVGDRLLAAVEVSVQPGEDAVEGASVHDLVRDFNIVPVALRCARAAVPAERWLDHCLAPGDRLTAIIALADLDRFYRRETAERAPADQRL